MLAESRAVEFDDASMRRYSASISPVSRDTTSASRRRMRSLLQWTLRSVDGTLPPNDALLMFDHDGLTSSAHKPSAQECSAR